MRSNIEVKPKHRKNPQDCHETRQGGPVNMSLLNWSWERFLQSKRFDDRVQDLHFQRKQTKFRLHCTISSRCDQTSRSNRNIGKNPQHCHESRQGVPINMPLFNSFRERFLKRKSFEDTVQDLHFQRKQIKFRLHCTISIEM